MKQQSVLWLLTAVNCYAATFPRNSRPLTQRDLEAPAFDDAPYPENWGFKKDFIKGGRYLVPLPIPGEYIGEEEYPDEEDGYWEEEEGEEDYRCPLEDEYCKPKHECKKDDKECKKDCTCQKKDHEYFIHHYHHHRVDLGELKHKHDEQKHKHEHEHNHHYDPKEDEDDKKKKEEERAEERRARFLASVPTQREDCEKKHAVVKGDTCWDISQANGITLDALRGFNANLDGECRIFPGQSLCLSERRLVPIPEAERNRLADEAAAAADAERARNEQQRGGGGGGERTGEEAGRERERERQAFLREFEERLRREEAASGDGDGAGDGGGRGREREGEDFLRGLRERFGEGGRERFLREFGERFGRGGDEGGGREEFFRRLQEHFRRARDEGEGKKEKDERDEGRKEFYAALKDWRERNGIEEKKKEGDEGEEGNWDDHHHHTHLGHDYKHHDRVKRDAQPPLQNPWNKYTGDNSGFKRPADLDRTLAGERPTILVDVPPYHADGDYFASEPYRPSEGKKKKKKQQHRECAGEHEGSYECEPECGLHCGRYYEVRRGDTGHKIWRRFGLEEWQFRQLNPWLNRDCDIYPGDRVCVSGCGFEEAEEEREKEKKCPEKQECKASRYEREEQFLPDPRCAEKGHTCQAEKEKEKEEKEIDEGVPFVTGFDEDGHLGRHFHKRGEEEDEAAAAAAAAADGEVEEDEYDYEDYDYDVEAEVDDGQVEGPEDDTSDVPDVGYPGGYPSKGDKHTGAGVHVYPRPPGHGAPSNSSTSSAAAASSTSSAAAESSKAASSSTTEGSATGTSTAPTAVVTAGSTRVGIATGLCLAVAAGLAALLA